MHPVSDVLNSLSHAGLEIGQIREYPFTFWKQFPFMRRGRDGWWHLTEHPGMVPLMWSVSASKPKIPTAR
jgi:hypothetical protein